MSKKFTLADSEPRIREFLDLMIRRAGFSLTYAVTAGETLHPDFENPDVLVRFSGQDVDLTSSGVTYHVPASLGLAIGSRHEFEISFQYLFHPAQKQVSGAAALGLVLNLG